MSSLHGGGNWNVGRAGGSCASCGCDLPAGTVCWAALCERRPEQREVALAGGDAERGGSAKGKQLALEAAKENAAIMAAPFVRIEFCEACWVPGFGIAKPKPQNAKQEATQGAIDGEIFSYWKTSVPEAQQKKKLLVDDSVLMDVFARMEGRNEAADIRFRFVLALILMRKRLLKYEGTQAQQDAGGAGSGVVAGDGAARPEIWRMIPRGATGESPLPEVQVINPHLTAEQIAEVSQQLSAILAEEV